jgi:hypothetical protein
MLAASSNVLQGFTTVHFTRLILWDMLMMLLILYYAIATPQRIGYDIDPDQVMENVLTVLFLLDIVLNYFTGFYDKGLEVKNKTLIAKDYVKFKSWGPPSPSTPSRPAGPRARAAPSR